MGRTGWGMLGGLFAVAAAISYAGIRFAVDSGLTPPAAPWITLALLAVLAVVLLLRGRGVRRLVAREETEMTAIGAARTLVLAKTSSVTGSIIGGFFLAQLLVALTHPPSPVRSGLMLSGLLGLAVCAALAAVALLVEGWCRIDPPEGDDLPGGSATPAGA